MTPADTAQLLANAYRYWHPMPESPAPILSTDELMRAHRGHYFDRDTMRFFGTRHFRLITPGVSVECQTGAPAGVDRYAVVAWTVETFDRFTYVYRTITPTLVARCSTRTAATKLAVAIPQAWDMARSVQQATKNGDNQ